jgi:hypothetical protein
MTDPPICPSQCSNEEMQVLHFPWILFTQATCNARMKIIALNKGIALKEYFIEGMDNCEIYLPNVPFECKKCEY